VAAAAAFATGRMGATTTRGPRYGVILSAIFHVLIAASAFITLQRNFNAPEDTHVVPVDLVGGLLTWYGGSAQEAAQYRYSNGSCLVVGGLDNSTRIMSTDYDLVYV